MADNGQRKFLGQTVLQMRPTKRHRAAVWECLLGTVAAQDDAGVVKYFDYDYEGALAYAGVSPERKPRLNPYPKGGAFLGALGPVKGERVLWVLKA